MSDGPLILIVDDDVVFCNTLRAAMGRRGVRALIAHSFDDAIAEAEAWSPDRAVVDLRMPGRNGLDVIEVLHQRDPDMRIVVLTSYGSIATAVGAIKRGACNYLTKPADVDDILAAFDGEPRPALATRAPSVEEVEWEHIQTVLASADGNVSEAARRLGMHRRTLQRKLTRGRPGGDEPE